ncbi:sphingomyelin phosphodiesterase-like [Tubulanus polymorphus]|uniref:sphingomyelin phosphodiesterase-like n=1 Tax=Tubulanus polymorphus TaxID=672921 RepID=UPI003DA20738
MVYNKFFAVLVVLLAILVSHDALPLYDRSASAGHLLLQQYLDASRSLSDHVIVDGDAEQQTSTSHVARQQLRAVSKALWSVIWSRYTRGNTEVGTMSCATCRFLVIAVKTLIEQQPTREKLIEGLISICKVLKIEDTRVCDSVIREFQNEVLYVVSHLVFDADELCGLVVGDSCGKPYNPMDMWNVSLPNIPKPPIRPPVPPKPGSPTLRILQLADIHYDPLYKIGSNAKCGEPLCCHEVDGMAPPGKPVAGKWGYPGSCDSPIQLIENLFAHINKTDKFDMIYWTGDLPSHNVWNQTRAQQIAVYKTLTKLFLKYFPGVPIYGALGNHESAPVNSFPPPFITGDNSIRWLYSEIDQSWSHWLLDSTRRTILYGGYYTALVKPGLRVVSLNMNYCNNQNWWLLLNSTDPAQELQWLVDVLQHAENNHEKVHIIGHIPNGKWDCMKPWSWNYYNIINRYEGTVAGQFFGHTHKDEFEIFYDQNDVRRANNIVFISPSITPFTATPNYTLNSGYRIYTVDNTIRKDVLDHETYILNITEANISNDPKWVLEYKAKDAYGMTSLYPRDWDKLVQRMKTDDESWNKFQTYYVKSSDSSARCEGSACRHSMLCALQTGRSHDQTFCN